MGRFHAHRWNLAVNKEYGIFSIVQNNPGKPWIGWLVWGFLSEVKNTSHFLIFFFSDNVCFIFGVFFWYRSYSTDLYILTTFQSHTLSLSFQEGNKIFLSFLCLLEAHNRGNKFNNNNFFKKVIFHYIFQNVL